MQNNINEVNTKIDTATLKVNGLPASSEKTTLQDKLSLAKQKVLTVLLSNVNASSIFNNIQTIIEANSVTLGLDTTPQSMYANLNNEFETGRQDAVSKDIFYSKPQGGYTLNGLKTTFNRAVQSRSVIKDVIAEMHNAKTAEELVTVIDNNFYTDLITDLEDVQTNNIYTHQGSAAINQLVGENKFLNVAFDNFHTLDNTQKLDVSNEIFTEITNSTKLTTSWTNYHNLINAAINNLGN